MKMGLRKQLPTDKQVADSNANLICHHFEVHDTRLSHSGTLCIRSHGQGHGEASNHSRCRLTLTLTMYCVSSCWVTNCKIT